MEQCPRLIAGGDGAQWIRWWRHYCNGALPVAGGLLDQSQPYLDGMDLIDRWMEGAAGGNKGSGIL